MNADLLFYLPGCLLVPAQAPIWQREGDALDWIAQARQQCATWVVVPTAVLAPEFFTLSSGLAGALLQKFVTYGLGIVVLGDITAHTARSSALQDFVRESNRGRHVWFVADEAALQARLET